MLPAGRPRSFLLSVTLTELAILMFFVLLFTASKQIRAERETSEARRDSIAQLAYVEAGLDALTAVLSASPASVQPELLRQAAANAGAQKVAEDVMRTRDSLLAENTRTRMRAESLATTLSRKESEQRGMELLIAERTGDGRDFQELVRTAAENIGDRERARELLVERDSLARALSEADSAVVASAELLDDNRNLRGQLLNLQQRMGAGGRDYPPCWADSVGGIEYIYSVVLMEDRLSVRPIWPPHREADVDAIPGARSLIGEDWTRSEFRGRAQPILDWSRRQDPECRHFVRIADRIPSDKAAFKAQLLLVEDYFYKYLPPDSPRR
jgi:hypothetical protein